LIISITAAAAKYLGTSCVADSQDILDDPQLIHLSHFVCLPHPLRGDSVIEASRFQLSDTPVGPTLSAPTFGRDIDYVLGNLLG